MSSILSNCQHTGHCILCIASCVLSFLSIFKASTFYVATVLIGSLEKRCQVCSTQNVARLFQTCWTQIVMNFASGMVCVSLRSMMLILTQPSQRESADRSVIVSHLPNPHDRQVDLNQYVSPSTLTAEVCFFPFQSVNISLIALILIYSTMIVPCTS
jgi:hypothetical protein